MIGGNEMFVCTNCGYLFEEPDCWEEQHSLEYGPFEKWSGCPKCGETYTEAHKCDCCDEWIDDIYIKTEDDKRYCLECYRVYRPGEE
jgi:hypothetical protein